MISAGNAILGRGTLNLGSASRDVALVVGGSVLVALSARITVSVPVGPVPITAQTFAVLTVGALLGSRRGALSLLTYLAEGLAGMPVFAAGNAGAAYILGPTGGYLVGFVAAAYVVGLSAETLWDKRKASVPASLLVATLIIYVPGVLWLSRLIGFERAVASGLLPFIPGDVLKALLCLMVLPMARERSAFFRQDGCR